MKEEMDHWEAAEEIAQFIYRNPSRRIPLPEIADRCNFSPFYLNRLFRSVVGESIYAFEKHVRLDSDEPGCGEGHAGHGAKHRQSLLQSRQPFPPTA
jgi:AraC-like DNA-binding protein